ncbi:MAG: hypothetical protein RIM23_07170 [Coleofasciculus sp. G3-WIS-01]|uniref:hypothetical protein n=1 Tax=Coleofasciculus sp. G3-WIS-01 TaxID=3069528 RepID=UPI0032F5C006
MALLSPTTDGGAIAYNFFLVFTMANSRQLTTTIDAKAGQVYIPDSHPDNRNAYWRRIHGIQWLVILTVVGLGMFGCKSSQPTQDAQRSSPPASETPADFSFPVITPNVSPLPTETPTPSPLPTPTISPTPPEIVVLPTPEQVPNNTPSVPPQIPSPTPEISKAVPPPLPKPPGVDTPKPTMKGLPDGSYFYGESAEFDRPGSRYLVFIKTDDRLIGQEYFWQTEQSRCFKGIANENIVKNVKTAYREPSREAEEVQWSFEDMNPIKLSELQPIGWEKAPDFAKSNLQECVKLFSVFND